jgi:membrane protease YdiL (CAAX protease family)
LDHDAALTPTEPIPPAPTSPSTLRWIFIGKDGLRAGWSLLIFLLLIAAITFSANRIGHKIQPHPPDMAKLTANMPARFLLLSEAIPFLIVFFVTWIMSKIERRPNSVYGFGGSRKLPQFFAGLAWGVICLSLLVLILWKAGLLVIDSRLVFGTDILRYGAIWLFGFFLVGLFEEYFLRGYLQYTLSRGLTGLYQAIFKSPHSAALGFWTTALLLSTLFGLGHGSNPGESPIGLLSAGLAGLLFCFALWRTGSLWWAIGFHTSWDWAQSFLYGVADSGMMVQHHLLATHAVGKPILSGGATGPEGSIFIIAVFALASAVIILTLSPAHSGSSQSA